MGEGGARNRGGGLATQKGGQAQVLAPARGHCVEPGSRCPTHCIDVVSLLSIALRAQELNVLAGVASAFGYGDAVVKF